MKWSEMQNRIVLLQEAVSLLILEGKRRLDTFLGDNQYSKLDPKINIIYAKLQIQLEQSIRN